MKSSNSAPGTAIYLVSYVGCTQ